MGEELTRSLGVLADRGDPRGADTVLADARRQAEEGRALSRWTWRNGPAVALGAATAVVVLIGVVVVFIRPFGGEPTQVATEPLEVVTAIPETPEVGVESFGPLNEVGSLAFAPDGGLWATTAGGLVRWDVTTATYVTFAEGDGGVPTSDVETLEVAPDGTVWIGARDWLARYDGSWHVYSPQNIPELESELGSLVVDRNGVVWVIAGSEYLLRFDGSWAAVAPPAGERIGPLTAGDGLAVAPNGTLWFSTFHSGVVAFDGTTWQRYSEDDGAPPGPANVAVASDGSVWFGSDRLDTPGRGITRFDGNTWMTFTVDDGLLSSDGSVVAAPDGTVWVIHDQGLSWFDGSSWATTRFGEGFRGGGPGAAGSAATLWMPSGAGIIGFDGTDTTRLVVPLELATPSLPAITLTPIPGLDPILVSTVIGDLEFVALQFPVGHGLQQVTATRNGPVAIDSFTSLRWSSDGVTWESILPTVDPWRITAVGEDLIVHGEELVRYAWDGRQWTEVSIVEIPGGVRYFASSPRGTVVVSSETMTDNSTEPTVYFSTDGVAFARAEAGPNRELLTTDKDACVQSGPSSYSEPPQFTIGPVLASDAGFVVLTPAHPNNWGRTPICEPLLWFSADGNRWELLSPQSPFGEGAIVHSIAEYAGRFVAIGAARDPEGDPEGAVWSSDDGLTWQRASVEPDTAVGIAGGDLGWILVGSELSVGDYPAMWFSADGLDWDGPYAGPADLATFYFLPELAVGGDAIYGVGGTHETLVIGRLQK